MRVGKLIDLYIGCVSDVSREICKILLLVFCFLRVKLIDLRYDMVIGIFLEFNR